MCGGVRVAEHWVNRIELETVSSLWGEETIVYFYTKVVTFAAGDEKTRSSTLLRDKIL